MAHPITTSLLHPLFVNAFPRFRLLFGNHGVTHPTQERRSPCPAGSAEERKAPMDQGSAGESLDGGELD